MSFQNQLSNPFPIKTTESTVLSSRGFGAPGSILNIKFFIRCQFKKYLVFIKFPWGAIQSIFSLDSGPPLRPLVKLEAQDKLSLQDNPGMTGLLVHIFFRTLSFNL